MLHMRACKAVGTVIVPWWPKQQWWHLVRSADGSRWAAAVRDAREINVTRPRDFVPARRESLTRRSSAIPAAIAAFHEFSSSGKVTEHPLVCAVRNYARRVQPAGENRKESITWEKVEQANLWLAGQAQSLRNLSLATAISLGFCGFFRYDDLSHIRVNNLKLVGESLLEIRFETRKNDQYREGSLIVLSAIESYSCPVKSV
ncbi:hypothetical protein COCOBI_17-2020 [Coccomyxa sp. Obi]|nr:hypothetical protein COCOBI_17-2020 [Coccomyxa sp. Obi]